MQLTELINLFYHFIFTIDSPHINEIKEKHKIYSSEDPIRSIRKHLKLIISSVIILIREKPNIIISTGGGNSLWICLIGKIFFKKIIWIESITSITSLTLSGSIIYPISDLFIVQWEELHRLYKKSTYWGWIY